MTVAITCCLWRFPISDRDPDCMEKLGYTDTETLLWDYSETELYHVLVIPPARARRTLYRITAEYAFQWFGLNGQNNLTVVYYPFSQVNFRNLTDPCICPPEADAFTATVTVSPSSVLEDGGIPLVFTIRLDRISASDATIDFTLAGSAIEGVDYSTVAPHSVTISAGALTAQVSVDPLIDLLFESTETVTMALTSGVSGPGLIDVTGAMATGLIIETMAPPLPAWQRPLSVMPDAPIWHHARADQSSFGNVAWLANAAAGCDRFYDYCVFLEGFEGVNGTTFGAGFSDESVTVKGPGTLVAAGPTITTSQFLFGSSGLDLIATGGLAWADSNDFNFSNGLFTVEAAIRPDTVAAGVRAIMGQWFPAGGNAGWTLAQSGSTLIWRVSTTGSNSLTDITSASVFSTGTWYQVAVDFDGIKYRLYVNGTMVGSSLTLRTIFNSGFAFAIGNTYGGGGITVEAFDGTFDEMRISKGVARYASDSGYAVATTRFPRSRCFVNPPHGWEQMLSTMPPSVTRAKKVPPSTYTYNNSWLAGPDPYFSNVVLLMPFEGANGSTGTPGMDDFSPSAHGTATLLGSGTAAISTAQFKFGSSSLSTVSSNVHFPNSQDWNFSSSPFTIEMWIRPNAVVGNQFLCGLWGVTGPFLSWIVYIVGTQLAFNVSVTGSDNFNVFLGGTVGTGAQYAIAVDFDGTKYRGYINGAMVASSTTLRTIHDQHTTGSVLGIGDGSRTIGTSFPYNGFIDELRITKGVARYASDSGYTVATAAFPRS